MQQQNEAPSGGSQRAIKEVYGDKLLAGELRWLTVQSQRSEMLDEARKLWPEEKNVSKLLRMYCITKGKVNVRLLSRKVRMVSVKRARIVNRRREELIRRVSKGYDEVPIINPAAVDEEEKNERYLRSHSQISKKIPRIRCPKCDGLMSLGPVCGGCREARGLGGKKYRTKWICSNCEHSIRSTKSLGVWVNELGKDGGVADYDLTAEKDE